ncbi:hypothetical protein [Bacteriovorax sp. Seq25_V]|uniref:hypothetical protein n=1 Tax=Bacteriovorax sp. Seq25_V TaxID=1201288 RepID=UPI000389E494|nr:hypothetical protein [Bacteriovorax sp. Seq25_V]EQC47517.1 putative lipoprotein [Bacteriovorax sp. Seq25_V]
MFKKSMFCTLMFSTLLATSCSKQAPLVVKNEVAPPPEVYTSAMAIDDLSLLDDTNAGEILSRISTNLKTDDDWSLFWKDLYIKYNSYAWSGATLSRIIDLSGISCGKKGSVAFSEFTQKILDRITDEEKEELLIKALKHYDLCGLNANQTLVREYLSQYKKLQNKNESAEFVKLFSVLMGGPLDEELADITDMVGAISDKNKKLELYYSFKGNYQYKGIVDKIVDSFDYSEIVQLASEEKIDFDDALEILNISKHQQNKLSKDEVVKLLATVRKNYQRATSKLSKYNLSKFHYETLKNLKFLSLSEVETWAKFALENYDDISSLYPRDSVAKYFLSSMNGTEVSIDAQYIDEKIDDLLVKRAQLQVEKDIQKNNEIYKALCNLYKDFGVAEEKYSKPSDLNKLGCKKYLGDKEIEVDEVVAMPLFSGLDTSGVDVDFSVRPSQLSVINTSQNFKYEKVSDVVTESKYDHIVVPLVFAFAPLKDMGRFKAGQKHYVAIHHVYRDARELIPGLEGVQRPLDGKRAGNLKFTRSTFSPVKHIAFGGEGQVAARPKKGAKGYVNSLDQIEIRSWVESFAGNSNFYFSDQFKNVRNLKNLIEASTSDANTLSLYIDPDYLSTLSSMQRESLLENLSEIKRLEGMGDVSDEIALETLVRRSTRVLIDTIEGLDYSASLNEIMPSLFTELELGSGPEGENYTNGKRGQNGQTIIE